MFTVAKRIIPFFFFNDTATTEIYTLSLHDALPIRARAAQFCEWMGREQPDVVCLQELKAESAQIPEACRLEDYYVYWHCMKAYSGVSLHIRRSAYADRKSPRLNSSH